MTCCLHGLLSFREIQFSCLIFFFFSLFSLLSLVSNSKPRLAEKGEGGKGKLRTMVLSFERPGHSALSRAFFLFALFGFCSPVLLISKNDQNSAGTMDLIAASDVKLELIAKSSWKPGWGQTCHHQRGSDLQTVANIWREVTFLSN